MATVQIDGADVHYRECGDGAPLLLIHGNGGGSIVWGDTIENLARDFRVIAYDRRGFGHSTHTPVTDFHRHGKDAAALLRALDAAPATVVGWSGGGITALDLAVSNPGIVGALVLAEPPLHAKRHLTFRMARTMIIAQLLRRTQGDVAAAEHFYRWASRRTSGGNAYDEFPPAVQNAMQDSAAATLAELGAGTGEHLTASAIGSIRCPVTCLLGDLTDPALAAATDRIAGMLRQASVVTIPGAGHALHFDQAEKFAAAVRATLAQEVAPALPTAASGTGEDGRP